jgi:hypothetical protein
MELCWVEDMMNAYLVAPKQPRRDQAVFARVYLRVSPTDQGTIAEGWQGQYYVSILGNHRGPVDQFPLGLGGCKNNTFKSCKKEVEKTIIAWFKGMGVEVTIQKADFDNKPEWNIKIS